MENIYLDYAASTPIDPRIARAVAEAMTIIGNPSSSHSFGRVARTGVDRSRASVARLFETSSDAVIFTSGATEANALALLGTWRHLRRDNPGKPLRLLMSPIEHASVTEAIAYLASEEGAIVDLLPVGKNGVISVDDVRAALLPETALVTVMWANNVIGTVQPIAAIGQAVARERERRSVSGVPIVFHCDAVQAAATQRISMSDAGVDLLTVSAHKMYGPKGVGALIVSKNAVIDPLVVGGGQENGMRGGTENFAAIVGFGHAADLCVFERVAEVGRLGSLRAKFLETLGASAVRAEVIGDAERVIPGTVFIRMASVTGDMAAMALDVSGIAVSAGSACDSGKRKLSSTLKTVMGEQRAQNGGVRISFGRFTTEAELQTCVRELGKL